MECFICKFPVRKGAQYVAIVRTVERRTRFGWIKVKKAKTLRVMHPWCERQMGGNLKQARLTARNLPTTKMMRRHGV